MSNLRVIAQAISWDAIGDIASQQRNKIGFATVCMLPVMEVMELVLAQGLGLFELLVGSKKEMGSNEGLTDPAGHFIMLREDVYLKAYDGDPRARFTVAHEWGHWTLHVNQPLARAPDPKLVRPYQCAELQAHQFAAEVLMPRDLIKPNETVASIMSRFGVSKEAALRRHSFLRKKGIIR